jgi:hypothetical protein
VTKYDWLLLVHISGAFLFLSGSVVAGVLALAAMQRERPSEVAPHAASVLGGAAHARRDPRRLACRARDRSGVDRARRPRRCDRAHGREAFRLIRKALAGLSVDSLKLDEPAACAG